MITIALDAMGGDYAPSEIVRGALEAVREERLVHLILVGHEARIRRELRRPHPNISIVHTDESIDMDESPSSGLKKKKRASIILAAQLVRDGQAQALLSAGNTGALLEVAVLVVGRIRGIRRPAIATFWPTQKGAAMLLDSGANADNKAEHLVQYAMMGSLFAKEILGVASPKVGLLNIGEEAGKGTAQIQEAFQLLKSTDLHFIGNVEPAAFLTGEVQVAICEGFIGNMVLKTAEAVSEFLFEVIKKELMKRLHTKVLSGLLKPAFRAMKKRLDYAEYGAAPFLGVNAVCLKSHGKSRAKAIKNAIHTAVQMVQSGIMHDLAHLAEEVKIPSAT